MTFYYVHQTAFTTSDGGKVYKVVVSLTAGTAAPRSPNSRTTGQSSLRVRGDGSLAWRWV